MKSFFPCLKVVKRSGRAPQGARGLKLIWVLVMS